MVEPGTPAAAATRPQRLTDYFVDMLKTTEGDVPIADYRRFEEGRFLKTGPRVISHGRSKIFSAKTEDGRLRVYSQRVRRK